MKTLFFALVIIFFSLSALAREKTINKKFIIVNGFMVNATVFDVETTYRGLKECPSCKELNPIMRPLINSGRPAIYAVEMSIDAAIICYSYKLKKEDNRWWWIMPVVVGSAHSIAGVSNLSFYTKFTF